MGAKQSAYIQAYLNSCVTTNDTLRQTLLRSVNNDTPNLYVQPSKETESLVNDFIDTLVAFENVALADVGDAEQASTLLSKIYRLQDELQLRPVRPKEAKNNKDWIMFVPKIVDSNTPVKIAAVLVYRFGFINDLPTDNSEDHTVGNLGLVSEHSRSDGAESLTAELFLKCKAKFIVANFFKPHTVANPNYDPDAKPPSTQAIKYFTDPAHSNTTIFAPILMKLLQDKFRTIPILIMHGMGAKEQRKHKILIGNCKGKFRDDGWPSFANLLASSFAIEDFYTSDEDMLANKPTPIVKIASPLPNSVVKGDQVVPMCSDLGDSNGALLRGDGVISSNVTGHIRYFAGYDKYSAGDSYADEIFADRILKEYQSSDNAIHVEADGGIRTNKSEKHENRDQFVKVVLRAMRWHLLYDPAIHDLHRLADRFIEVSSNMKLYGRLFMRKKMDNYKENKAEIYDNDTKEYRRSFARRKQLPPPLLPTPVSAMSDAVSLRDSIAENSDANESQESDYATDEEDAAVPPRVLMFTRSGYAAERLRPNPKVTGGRKKLRM